MKKIMSLCVDDDTYSICKRLNKLLGSKKSVIIDMYLKKGGLK